MSMVQLKCFHGTSKENARAIISQQHFNHGTSDSLRLGEGAYFFNQTGSKPDYPIMCAYELRKHKFKRNPDERDYCILSCVVECADEDFLDLDDPDFREVFHEMRYHIHSRNLKTDPTFKYPNAALADTQVIEEIKKERRIAVIRASQFFGMFEKEQRMKFSNNKESQNPRTYVPNVVNVCVNTNLAIIRDIKVVKEGEFDAECRIVIG